MKCSIVIYVVVEVDASNAHPAETRSSRPLLVDISAVWVIQLFQCQTADTLVLMIDLRSTHPAFASILISIACLDAPLNRNIPDPV
jgi:hypothetical protein